MKKIAILVLAMVLLLAMACGKAPAPSSAPAPATVPKTATTGASQTPKTTTAPSPTAAATTQAGKKTFINFASGSASGTIYFHAAIAASLLNTLIPDISVTALETAGALDNVARLKRGEVQMISALTQDIAYQVYNGKAAYEKEGPYKKIRFLSNIGPKQYVNVVRADTGVKKPEDLNGKKFNAGDAGGATAAATMDVYNVLGIKPDWQPMTSTQAVAAIKDRRIVGHVQAGGSMTDLAASTIDLRATVGVNILTFTKEQMDKAQKALPWIPWTVVPAGGYEQAKELPEIRGYGSIGGVGVTSDMPQSLTYQIAKVLNEKRSVIGQGYKGVLQVKPIIGEIEFLQVLPDPPPLAAGVVQYAVEKGITVPPNLIPPEYVPVPAKPASK